MVVSSFNSKTKHIRANLEVDMVMDKSWDNVIKPVIGKIDGFSSLVAP